jgi:hypothetical protein
MVGMVLNVTRENDFTAEAQRRGEEQKIRRRFALIVADKNAAPNFGNEHESNREIHVFRVNLRLFS